MSANEEPTPITAEGEETAVAVPGDSERMALDVEVRDIGPCKKHVRVRVPRGDLDRFYGDAVEELARSANVPGFRIGHVPRELVGRRFRRELADEVKQKVLVESLEQVSEDNDLDPINEPNIDIANISIPDAGDFEYEFDVEVRPVFDLPDYAGMQIDRPAHEVTDEDVDSYLKQFLSQYGRLAPHEGAAEKGDAIIADVEFTHDGETLRMMSDLMMWIRPVLRFRDAEIAGFDELMVGVRADETREADITISQEAAAVKMRGQTVHVTFSVNDVKRPEMPELNREFLDRIGVETEEELRSSFRGVLERQVKYQQRQSVREQVLDKITDSADWELPEELVAKQVENALYRETLEMQQAGFASRDIQARENELRQKSVSSTRLAMKQHFILDKIATQEAIQVTHGDIDIELQHMAAQRGESVRRLRSRLIKSGVIENLEAQIRERKAVDVILDRAVFNDVPMDWNTRDEVEAINQSVCTDIVDAPAVEAEDDGPEAESGD